MFSETNKNPHIIQFDSQLFFNSTRLQGSPPIEKAFCLGLNFSLDKKNHGNNKVLIDSSEPQDKI